MQKVYLLLRSNQQTGPYNLEELLQFDLKPYDLIWIEGRSAGWYYPQEIPALLPHLSFIKQSPPAANTSWLPETPEEKIVPSTAPKKVFVSLPSAVKETTASALKPSNNDKDQQQKSPEEAPAKEELRTTYAKSIEEVETDYMNWAYQKKTKKKKNISMKGALVACLIVSVAFASWKLLQPADENLQKTPPEQTAFLPSTSEATPTSVEEVNDSSPIKTNENKNKKAERKPITAGTKKIDPVEQNDRVVAQQENKPVNTIPQADEEVISGTTETKIKEEKQAETVAVEAPNEKKKLRDKIADLFRKKPDEKKDDAKPAEEEEGERRSVRREAGSNLAQMLTIKFAIPNDWMMGIKGARATLTNRSSESIVKAVVEVVYYNDDNDVLDKRTISFANIKSKQTQTIAVPDHHTATRLEYNVISATGAGEPFAKR